MPKNIYLNQATRIEGQARIHIEISDGRIEAARLLVADFRGFEGFARGKQVEFVPGLVSRICGLCSASHQIAALKAIEEALGLTPEPSVTALREIILLGEWISSHALSYFFLTLPDLLGAPGGIFELRQRHPELAEKAFLLRRSGLKIVRLLAGRASHPITLGIGGFLSEPEPQDLEEVVQSADRVRAVVWDQLQNLQEADVHPGRETLRFPEGQPLHFAAYSPNDDHFLVFDRQGRETDRFSREGFEEQVGEMQADWSLAKFPYLARYGFPAGIMIVGPLARSFLPGGVLDDPELNSLPWVRSLGNLEIRHPEHIDFFRLLEIFRAAGQIRKLAETVEQHRLAILPFDPRGSGLGRGVVEAPRGLLVHTCLVQEGRLEQLRLLVATQFNNPFINLLLRRIAEDHLHGEALSSEGERLIGRCLRVFDPCLSCATH